MAEIKVAMFSGQGSQKVGMGQELYQNHDICKDIFHQASEALGMDMAALCFQDRERLNQTEYAQPALLTVGVAALALAKQQGFQPDILMGLSLGEYTALTAAGVMDFADAVRLVHTRGKIMSTYAPEGGMVASIGLASTVLEEICQNITTGFVACANYNTPDQTVLAGEHNALEAATAAIKAAGGKAMPLKVAGPFHTKLMAAAAESFAQELAKISVKTGTLPVMSNVTGQIFQPATYVETLTTHMMAPVRWVSCVDTATAMGATTFLELGCGNTLGNFVKKINGTHAIPTLDQITGGLI